MQRNYSVITSRFLPALFTAALFLGGCKNEPFDEGVSATSAKDAKGASAETAQSAMVDFVVNAPVVEGEVKYTFDEAAAAASFIGGTLQQRKNVAQDQRCTFFNGGTLVSAPVGGGPNLVIIYPRATMTTVAPQTAWNTTVTGTAVSTTTIDIALAAQSVVVNSQKDGPKYSFSLSADRVEDLKVEVTGQEEEVAPAFAVLPDEYGSLVYVDNGGKFGTEGSSAYTALQTGMPIAEILALNAYAATTVSADNTALAKLEQLTYELNPGTYTVTVTGKLKGNAFSASHTFTVSGTVTVAGEGNCRR